MNIKESNFRIELKEDKSTGVNINAYTDLDDLDYYELKYEHIMTAQECELIEQIFAGWSEQDEEENKEWEELERRIKIADWTYTDDYLTDAETEKITFLIDENGSLEEK